MFRNFDEMKEYVKGRRRGRVVIAAAQTDSVLDAAILAAEEDLADCILVGNAGEIRELLQKMASQMASSFEIVDTGADLVQAAQTSVALVREGKADIILKGKTDTSVLLRAVLDKKGCV